VFRRAAEKQIRVRLSVIANQVSTRTDFFYQRRSAAYVFSNNKEGGFRAIAIQQIEKFRSDGGIRTVVERQSQLATVAGMAKSVTEELGARVHRPVSSEARQAHDHSGTGDEPGIHRRYCDINSEW